jgi:hypothetical protein
MPLSGELTDLSLAELIEFFCNQRKTGCIEIICQDGKGNFYLDSGSLVHASIGSLSGIEAVHYALTLSKASFTFEPAVEASKHTIDQPWASVVLEGLRLLDEGFTPKNPFPNGNAKSTTKVRPIETRSEEAPAPDSISLPDEEPMKLPSTHVSRNVAFGTLLSENESPFSYGPRKLAWIFAAVILVVAVVAVPWGWYARSKTAKLAAETKVETSENSAAAQEPISSPTPVESSSEPSPTVRPKEVTVEVIYDESGRVIDAFGGNAEALKIARQRRFPAGKAGSATITVPSN